MNRHLFAAAGLIGASAVIGYFAIDAMQAPVPPPLAATAATPTATATPPAQGGMRDTTPGVTAGTPQPLNSAESEVTVEADPQSLPVRLEIPSIDVDTDLEQLGLLPDGSLATPEDTDLAGWFDGGPRPGQVGPAVIAGHVSWRGEPSVFFRLTELAAGDRITVAQEDGGTATFEVDRIEQHPKDAFPTVDVYSNTSSPELRLITCGGEFDSSTGHFEDNIVVFATQTSA